MEKTKKFAAVIGYGGMGEWHAAQLQGSDVFALAGVYDICKEQRARARRRGIHVYDSQGELLADARVKLVTVATPNDSHEEISAAAMRAGKHVLCEKPVTLTMPSLERLIKLSEETGRIFTVHQNRRFDTDHLCLKAIHDSGEIGEIISLESRYHGSRGIPGDWRGVRARGGGMLYDWGIHLIDQALLTLGWDVDTVHCRCDHITNREVDDGFRLEITLKSGKRAYIEVGTHNFIALPRFYMRGTCGTALIDTWDSGARVVRCDVWEEENVLPVQTAAGLTKTMAPRDDGTTTEYTKPLPAADVHDFYRNLAKAIDGAATPLVSHDEMRLDLRVILCAFASAESGETVRFSPDTDSSE